MAQSKSRVQSKGYKASPWILYMSDECMIAKLGHKHYFID